MSGPLQQQRQDLEGLFAELNPETLFPQFRGLQVDIEDTKADQAPIGRHTRSLAVEYSIARKYKCSQALVSLRITREQNWNAEVACRAFTSGTDRVNLIRQAHRIRRFQ